MKKYLIYVSFVGLSAFTIAQKDIVLSNDLAANTELLKVKMGTQWMGKIWKIKFGEYSVGASKNGWITQSRNANFLNTKTSSSSTQKFSFELNSGSSDKAWVNAAINIDFKAYQSVEIVPFVSLGENKILVDSENFSAMITINQDTTDTWLLLLNKSSGDQISDKHMAYLSNGDRTIHLVPVTSNKNGEDKRSIPAKGYEFIEPGKTLGAVQFYGGGMMGQNKNKVWINKLLDDRMKLILSAAITAVLQYKTGHLDF